MTNDLKTNELWPQLVVDELNFSQSWFLCSNDLMITFGMFC